jgi:hypothetical protein
MTKRPMFAEGTEVSVEKSRMEIERLIVRYGATSTAFMNAPGHSMILFEAKSRRIRFDLPLPAPLDKQFALNGRGSARTPAQRASACEQRHRELWRALALVIKAKLESVDSGITSFEDEFLAQIVMPDGKTVASHVQPGIAAAYQSGQMVSLLPPPRAR